jgi:hypothetical protein
MQMLSLALPGVIGGAFMVLLGVLCFVFNRKVGDWLGRFPLVVFGLKPKVEVDETISRGWACMAGLLYAGMGLMLLASLYR